MGADGSTDASCGLGEVVDIAYGAAFGLTVTAFVISLIGTVLAKDGDPAGVSA